MASLLLWIAVLIIGISSLTTDVSGPAPVERNWVLGKLDSTQSFGQTFRVDAAELVAVRVLLFAPAEPRNDLITLRLRYATTATPDLAVVSLPVRELARQGMTTFSLPTLRLRADPHAAPVQLQLTLEAPTLPPSAGVSVMAGPDTYAEGTLLANDVPRAFADLAFQPVYRQRWIDNLFPLSRLADGKPGVFGWPPLYPLLAYAYGCTLAYGLFTLWRRRQTLVDAL